MINIHRIGRFTLTKAIVTCRGGQTMSSYGAGHQPRALLVQTESRINLKVILISEKDKIDTDTSTKINRKRKTEEDRRRHIVEDSYIQIVCM